MTWNNGTPPAWFRRAQWKAAYSKRNGVHYVGDDVIIDLSFATSAYDTFERTATFDNGTDGQAITTSMRGSFSPLSESVGSPVFSSTHAYGGMSARFDDSGDYLGLSWNGRDDQFHRLYLYATQFPSTGVVIARGQGWFLGVNANGRPYVQDRFGTTVNFSSTISLSQWVRFEHHYKNSTLLQECRMFSADAVTPVESVSNPAAAGYPTDNLMRVGQISGTWGAPIWIDNVVGAAAGWAGPNDPLALPGSPVTYTVRDFHGAVVSEGEFDEGQEWFRPAVPGRGWKPGWYRVYLSGPQTSTNFYDSYGVTNVCVIQDDAHFVAMPAGNVVGGYNEEAPDYVMKGVMGLGTSRLIIMDLTSPAAEIATAQQDLALTQTYWADSGIPDSERAAREPWCCFPNCDGSPAQLAGVTQVVAALYPDCKYYEGPYNEPPMNAATATLMQAFAAAVHAGNANAKAIGPSSVAIHPTIDWTGFLDAGGGSYCDEISFHAYNAVTNGDMNLGKYTIQAFKDKLAAYGLSGKPLWQTESVHAGIIPYGIYHPRRARKMLMEWLLFERQGVPRERNNPWYDASHGFYDYPAWLENGDGSLEPAAVLARVFAAETWGKPYASAVDFGTIGNAIYVGNVYTNAAGASTVVLMATSYMTGASLALRITGTSGPVTVVDGFGNEKAMPLSRGRITLPMTDVPAYVRLPVGASLSVYRINGWSPLGTTASVSPDATTKQIDGVTYAVIADDAFQTNYGAGTGSSPDEAHGWYATPPSNTTLIWPADTTIERVIVWCGPAFQLSGTLIDFDIETYNGSTWTTRKTVTKQTPVWFDFGSDGTTSGCFQETYWDEQWIFDVELDSPIACQGVRLNVREASYGGEPLSVALIANGAGGGQGTSVQAYRVQEIAVVDANRYAAAAA